MYINAAAKNVTLQVNLRHNFCNIFKTKYKLYIVSWSACRRPSLHALKISGNAPDKSVFQSVIIL